MAKHPRRAPTPDQSGTPALRAVLADGAAHSVREHASDPAARDLGLASARALGVEPARVLKTLIVDAGGELVVGVVPVDRHLDLKALAKVVGAKKAALADAPAAERASGYVVGGISPLGQRTRLRTVVDSSALAHGTVFVSAGKRSLKLELAPSDLIRLTNAAVAEISTTTW
ncbi:MAG: Cys-tRNA(Pro) deacylase [Actinomycetota bacterium]